MNSRPTLDTSRLRLRPFELSDAAEVQRLAGARAIADTTLAIPHPYEDGVAETWISTHQENFDGGKGVNFAITRKSDVALIGAIGLMNIAAGHQAELGYWIGEPYWSQGFCTEAAQAVLDYAFQRLDLIRVHAHHLSRNPASGRVMQKIGMTHEGCQRSHVIKWGRPEDIEIYGILKQDWQAAHPTARGT